MFDVTATIIFLDDNGAEAKPAYTRAWAGVEKVHVVEQLERGLMRALMKMNQLSADMSRGKVPKSTTTNPVEMRLDAVITEDGEKWSRATFEWPKMGEEQQALMIGMINGELGNADDEVKDAEKKHGGKKVGK